MKLCSLAHCSPPTVWPISWAWGLGTPEDSEGYWQELGIKSTEKQADADSVLQVTQGTLGLLNPHD